MSGALGVCWGATEGGVDPAITNGQGLQEYQSGIDGSFEEHPAASFTEAVRGRDIPSRRRLSAKKDADGKPATFLTKLYAVLAQPAYQEMIHWDMAGKQIIVADPQRLEAMVLPSIYNQTRFASFSRQLNIYGFMRKVTTKTIERLNAGPESTVWSHPLLDRQTPVEQLLAYRRRVPPRIYSRKNSDNVAALPDWSPAMAEFDWDDIPAGTLPSVHEGAQGNPRLLREIKPGSGHARRKSNPTRPGQHPYRLTALYAGSGLSSPARGRANMHGFDVKPLSLGGATSSGNGVLAAPNLVSATEQCSTWDNCPESANIPRMLPWSQAGLPGAATAPASQQTFELTRLYREILEKRPWPSSTTSLAHLFNDRLDDTAPRAAPADFVSTLETDALEVPCDNGFLPASASEWTQGQRDTAVQLQHLKPDRQVSDRTLKATLKATLQTAPHGAAPDSSQASRFCSARGFGHAPQGYGEDFTPMPFAHAAQPIVPYLVPHDDEFEQNECQAKFPYTMMGNLGSHVDPARTRPTTSSTIGSSNTLQTSTMWQRTPSSGFDRGGKTLTTYSGQQSVASLSGPTQAGQCKSHENDACLPLLSAISSPGMILSELYATTNTRKLSETNTNPPTDPTQTWHNELAGAPQPSNEPNLSHNGKPKHRANHDGLTVPMTDTGSFTEMAIGAPTDSEDFFGNYSWPFVDVPESGVALDTAANESLYVHHSHNDPFRVPGEDSMDGLRETLKAGRNEVSGQSVRDWSEMQAFLRTSEYSFDMKR